MESNTENSVSRKLEDALRGDDSGAALLTLKVDASLRPWLLSKRRKTEEDGTKGCLGSAASRILLAVRHAEQSNGEFSI